MCHNLNQLLHSHVTQHGINASVKCGTPLYSLELWNPFKNKSLRIYLRRQKSSAFVGEISHFGLILFLCAKICSQYSYPSLLFLRSLWFWLLYIIFESSIQEMKKRILNNSTGPFEVSRITHFACERDFYLHENLIMKYMSIEFLLTTVVVWTWTTVRTSRLTRTIDQIFIICPKACWYT